MAYQIIEQGVGYEIGREDVPSTAVPYKAENRPDGTVNNGFIDLRDQPDLVVSIPEVAKSAGLAKLLRAINAPGSELMTLGCECGPFVAEGGVAAAGFAFYIGGYVGIAFRDSAMNKDEQALVELAKGALSRIEHNGEYTISFEIVVEPLTVFFSLPGRYALMWKPFGYGRTKKEAWAAFNCATESIAMAFER